MATKVSHQATIIKNLTKKVEDWLDGAFNTNTDRMFGRYFFWRIVEDYAKKQKEVSLETLSEEKLIEPYRQLTEGEYTIGESPSFAVTDKVSKPRKTFDPDVLAENLKKKYKVPVPMAREMIEKAKIDGNATHTIKIVER